MKTRIMIISDIHGGLYDLSKVLAIYEKEHFDRLFVLGDLLGYSYDQAEDRILELLNGIKDCAMVRGNCDPQTLRCEDILRLNIEGVKFTLTHGHRFSLFSMLRDDSDIICQGHTHRPSISVAKNRIVLNPGSITASRKGPNSFATIEDGYIYLKSTDNVVFEKVEMPEMGGKEDKSCITNG